MKTKYHYIALWSAAMFSVSIVGSCIEDSLHNISLEESLSEVHHYIMPLLLGIIAGLFGFLYWKRINRQLIALNQLKESEYKHRILFENMQDVVCLLDNRGNILDINEAGVKLFEYGREELLKMNVAGLVYKEDLQNSNEYFNKLNNQGFYSLYEGRIITKTGKILWIQVNSKEFIKDGIKTGSQDIIRDITVLKETEQKIIQQNADLKELNATKDKFFSIIAHDLRNPINTILGFSELLSNNFENYDINKKKNFLRLIHNGVDNIFKLLENLLIWSQSQRGTIVFKPEKVNLYLVANEAIKLFSLTAGNKSISMLNSIPENITLKADESMLSTVIRNLLSNAVKFTPHNGTIEINACLKSMNDNQSFVEIAVKDNGVGIPEEKKLHIFDFAQSTVSSGTDKEKGSGLGLILCKDFVEKHGGQIWVESNAGQGSTFLFTLPYAI
jgi:PAS domain S-box-containing protein